MGIRHIWSGIPILGMIRMLVFVWSFTIVKATRSAEHMDQTWYSRTESLLGEIVMMRMPQRIIGITPVPDGWWIVLPTEGELKSMVNVIIINSPK